ncbi:hypothetical protein COOONC_17336 [Cooperia oncophora]
MWWNIQDPDRIVSSGKDGLLVLHHMDQKQSPLSYACDMALDLAPDGLVGVAANSHIPIISIKSCIWQERQPYDPFRTPVRSQLSCGLPDNAMNTLQPSAFYKLAEKYLAGGRPLRTLCNHNANLAMHLGQSSVAQTWRLVGALLEQTGLQKVYDQDAREAVTAYKEKYDKYVSEMERHGKKVPEPPHTLAVMPTHLTRFSGNHSRLYRKEARLPSNVDQKYSEFTPSSIASGDFYFGAGELTKTTIEKGIENPHYNDFTGLKDEAFALKPDLTKSMFMSMTTSDDDGHLEKEHIARMNWNPMQEVARLLHYHADQGDMQTCATLALVCGRRLSDVVDDFTVESHVGSAGTSYSNSSCEENILGSKELTSGNSFSSFSSRMYWSSVEVSMRQVLCCLWWNVEGPLLKMNWFCRKCHHAGHPHHILEWFTTERTCPVGDCSCECGAAVVQSPEKRKVVIPKRTRRDLLRKRETNCYQPSTSSVQVQYESSSEEDSDSTFKVDDVAENTSMARFCIGKMPLDTLKSGSSQSPGREEKPEQERSSTLPIEHDLQEVCHIRLYRTYCIVGI